MREYCAARLLWVHFCGLENFPQVFSDLLLDNFVHLCLIYLGIILQEALRASKSLHVVK